MKQRLQPGIIVMRCQDNLIAVMTTEHPLWPTACHGAVMSIRPKDTPLKSFTVGKIVGEHVYLHVSALPTLDPDRTNDVNRAAEIAEAVINVDFNVVKLGMQGQELSLLSYPDFFEAGFPTLARSWRVSLSTETAVYRNYEQSCNPPILHRKELLIDSSHPRADEFRALTKTCETLGLFNDPSRIGTREYWHRLIEENGYMVDGHDLVPLANETHFSPTATLKENEIPRHLTALSRANFSAPVQALWRHGLITPACTFFDYGCGRGDDVNALRLNAISAAGWDPHYSADADKLVADTVNIGFVINVIEDFAERVAALCGAFSITRGVLSVAAMLSSQSPPDGQPFRDGFLSKRNTFQKYYSQVQLRDFIEATLDQPAIAVAPGVFFVFRDKELEQEFLLNRYGRQARNVLLRGWVYQRVRREVRVSQHRHDRQPRIGRDIVLFQAHKDMFISLWERCLALGRAPDPDELEPGLLSIVMTNVSNFQRALRICFTQFDQSEMQRAAQRKSDDLLVFASMLKFQKCQPYSKFDKSVQRDIRHFYHDYKSLQASACNALNALAALEDINTSCQIAAERGLGWLIDSQSLQLHTSLIPRLPSNLRIYIGCATVLYGDISEFDLVKIHIRSGKVTLMKFDDFTNSPLPRMTHRVKVNLRDLNIDVFLSNADYPAPLLYGKSRFINEEFSQFFEQVAFEEKLNQLGMLNFVGHGPSTEQFFAALASVRWEVEDFKLVRSKQIPSLDSACGMYFTYRDFIECGETQTRTKFPNIPLEPDTYTALYELAIHVLDPTVDYFGRIKLTYGFCSAALAKKINKGVAPHLDQHASHEVNRLAKPICSRLGAACDFIVEDENMEEVANWVAANTPFDRIYFYGNDRPIHVSYSTNPTRQIIKMMETKTGKRLPRIVVKVELP
jgi:DNA phosphorothioation-associated putative methyltransferase